MYDVYRLLPASIDRYVDGGFNWKFALESQAPALVFRAACNDVAGFRGLPTLPADVTHLKRLLKTNNILGYIQEGVRKEWAAQRPCPPNQYAADLPGYYSKLRFKTEEAYVFPPEFWLQDGNQESAVHVDHGRVISYIPPCARTCFKIWVSPLNIKPRFKWANKDDSINRILDTNGAAVLVQRPGDVVYLNSLVYHSVLLGFQPETQDENKWGAVFGDVIVLAEDRPQSFKYASQLASGAERGSRRAWIALLSAFCVMEGRVWKDDNFEAENKIFMEKLKLTKSTTVRSLTSQCEVGQETNHAGEDASMTSEEEGTICQHKRLIQNIVTDNFCSCAAGALIVSFLNFSRHHYGL